MWKSNLIIALRVLGRNKTISLINIVGLSVAFAVAVLCLLFVRHETSFDTWHEKGDTPLTSTLAYSSVQSLLRQ